MENVPKIVGERLKAAAVAVDHPDPDLLTAFSEHALREPERKQVLEHLARCGECREVVVLALPAEEATVAVLPLVRGKWLTWPRLRWGLVAAGVIVVGSFGALRYLTPSQPATVASYDAARTQEIAKAKNQTEPLRAAPEPTMTDEEKKAPEARSMGGAGKSKAAPEANNEEFDRLEQFAQLQPPARDKKADGTIGARGMLRSQALPHGPKPPSEQWQQNATANINNNANAFQSQTPPAAPTPAVPPEFARQQLSNQVVVTAQAPAPSRAGSNIGGPVSVNKQAQDLDTLAVQGKSAVVLQSGGSAGAEVARAKPAEPSANAPKAQADDGYTLSESNGRNFTQLAGLAPETARWSITEKGSLQRSLDQGRSWQDVDVTGAAEAGSGVSLRMAMKDSREKALAKGKSDMKRAPVVFRAVSANGPDVWAGGSGGHLYHSMDAGAHWVQVVPSWSGVELTSDIVSLQFADPLQGRIVTSSSEIWTTADAGQTWQKR